jgi:hypothetical protein
MNEMINFKGHFKIQAIDAFNNVVDEWEEHNMIMDSARYTMAKIFANIDYSATSTTKPFVDTVILGTLGNIDGDILTPKAAAEGFVKERTRLFSESINVGDSSIINIKQNDLIKYTGTGNLNGITGNYYIYLPTSDASINPLTTDFTDTNLWKNYGADKPYTYSVGFELPRTTDDACSL